MIKLNADSILSFGEHWNNLVLLAGLGKNFSVFVSDRCQPNKSLGKFQNLLRIWLYPKSKGVIAQTMQAKSIFHTMYEHENIGVIGNPISVKPKVEFLERENIVLSVGRLITSKHQEELIRLFVEIGKSDWKLVIVGGDALKQKNHSKLANLITELGIQNRVILTGAIKDVGFWYERASVFAFTSSSEGFPNVIGEALSYGVPVISFDCVAGPSDMITDGFNGYLVELFDFDMFRVRLAKLMDDESIRQKMSINAPRSVLKFEESMMVQNFFKFIT
ncbi:MAG: glycosyltransferase involved in cell wall biosynthesis [Halieaceae bacterium]